MLRWIWCISFSFLVSSFTHSQIPQFETGVIAGLNFAELEGEGVTDYFGLNAGIMGAARIDKRWQLSLEFLFSQNGEYIYPQFYPRIQYGRIRLNHLEIPIHFDYSIPILKRTNYYDLKLSFGIAYTRLLSYFAEDMQRNEVSTQILYGKRSNYLLQWGLTYYFTERVGLNLKATLPYTLNDLDWTIAARMVYRLS